MCLAEGEGGGEMIGDDDNEEDYPTQAKALPPALPHDDGGTLLHVLSSTT